MATGFQLTRANYWKQIASLATEVTKEARQYDRKPTDVLHEVIDGHQWVIYPAYHFDVLYLSDNTDAAWDNGLLTDVGQTWSDVTTVAVYAAMLADVEQHSNFDPEPKDDECPDCEELGEYCPDCSGESEEDTLENLGLRVSDFA